MLRLFNTIVLIVLLVYVARLVLDHSSPGPGPGPEPIVPVVSGMHALIVEETGLDRLWNYNDKSLDEFASANFAKIDGTPEFRIYDKDQDLSRTSKDWQQAMEDAKKHDLPWLEVWGSKRQRVSQILPGSAEETLKVLEAHKR